MVDKADDNLKDSSGSESEDEESFITVRNKKADKKKRQKDVREKKKKEDEKEHEKVKETKNCEHFLKGCCRHNFKGINP